MLAVGSQNHDFAVDLFARLKKRGVKPFVTRRMTREAWEHLEWAAIFIKENPSITPAFIAAALVKPGYKQNLFLDGFIRSSAEGKISSFEDYLRLCSLALNHTSVLEAIDKSGVRLTDVSQMEGFEQDNWAEVQELAELIKADRSLHLNYRSDEQVLAEAEVLYILKRLRKGTYAVDGDVDRAYFLSQSNVLNRVAKEQFTTTWTPESVYRYLLSLPGELPDPELLQECMLHEYFHAGISVIDKSRYLRFFGPSIVASRIAFATEKKRYVEEVESQFGADSLENAFEATPDLEKPLFIHRLTLRSVETAQRLAREALQRAEDAERKVRILERERENKWRKSDRARARQASATEKNATHKAETTRQKKVRKRKRKSK